MKIKFNSDNELPFNKSIKISVMVIVARAVFLGQIFIRIIKMLYYDRFDVSEGIDVNKTSASKECDICHYWYFLNYSFKFQPNVCNRCHDLLMMSVNLSNIVILNIKGSDYRCIISLISKNEAINLMLNTDLTQKSGTL